MPLQAAAPRKLLHLRDVSIRGYAREDGLVDIEARVTDQKTYSWRNTDRGRVSAGEPLHDMWLRVTLDRDMLILACEAVTEAAPHAICPGAAPNFTRLAGLRIGTGFLKAAMARVGGVEGCTHLRELLQPIATIAFQTMLSVRHQEEADTADREAVPFAWPNPGLANSCLAYDEAGPLMQSPTMQMAKDR